MKLYYVVYGCGCRGMVKDQLWSERSKVKHVMILIYVLLLPIYLFVSMHFQ